MTPTNGIGRVEEKIDGVIRLIEAIIKTQDEMQSVIKELAACSQRSQIDYTVVDQKVLAANVRLDAQEKEIDAHTVALRDFEEILRPLVAWSKVAYFITSVLGVTIIGFVWSIIIHAVTIVIP